MDNNKKIVADTNFIKVALDEKLSLEEFLLLAFFDNAFELIFDVNLISKTLKMDEEKVLESFSNLVEKKLIQVEIVKNDFGKVVEKIQLENFYNKIKTNNQKESKKEINNDIFSLFEVEFGRTLSQMDYEIIKAWLEKNFSEELIICALKEASYNGVKNLRYIDKILFEWEKKGIKTPDEINNRCKNDSVVYETNLLNFNWLDENE